MVLVAPRPLLRPAPPGDAPVDRGTGGEVLALLRGDAAARPRFDPGLAGGLRAWLEDAAYDVVAARGDARAAALPRTAPAAGLARRAAATTRFSADGSSCLASCTRCCASSSTQGRSATRWPTRSTRCGRQATMRRSATSRRCRRRPAPPWRRRSPCMPATSPAWSPGSPRAGCRGPTTASPSRWREDGSSSTGPSTSSSGCHSHAPHRCARSGLSTGGPWAAERRSLHYLSLLETLRSGAPPFRLALLESASGRYGVEDVREEHLRAIASHLAAWLARASTDHG